jgi:hypothetical protein
MKIIPKYPYPVASQAKDLTDQDWLNLTEYEVFKLIRNEEWKYSDFDVWLVIREKHHHKLSEDKFIKALEDFHRIVKTKSIS